MATSHAFRNALTYRHILPYTTKCLNLQSRCIAHTTVFFQKPPAPGGKKTYAREKPHMNVGTIGHVDHGKTTLTAAITRVLSESKQAKFMKYDEIDRTPDEKKRGITINATVVNYETEERHYGHVDCPGHRDYIKNMILGTARMDTCILVVAATDGAMPQTREHIILAKNIGINKMLVFINKVDAADAEMIELVEMEIREMLTTFGFDGDGTPIIAGSALKALNGTDDEIGASKVKELLKILDEYVPTPERSLDKPFSLPIESMLMITGRGLVVTGVLDQGTIRKGDDCEILGFNKKIKSAISGIEMFHQSLERAEAGDQMGCLLKGVKKDDLRRGMVVAKTGLYERLQNHFSAEVYLLGKEEGGRKVPVMPFSEFTLYNKAFAGLVALEIPDREMAMPGENTKLNMKLQYGTALLKGDRFTLRDGGGTIGYGVISEFLPVIDYEKYKDETKKMKKQKLKEKLAAENA